MPPFLRAGFSVIVSSLCLISTGWAEARDVASLKPCEIVNGKEVAGLAKGKLMSQPVGGPGVCTYLVELSDGTVESYGFSLQPAAGMEALWKVQSAEDKGDPVPGLWDEAHLAKRFMASGFSLQAVRRGDLAVEVTGERKDVLLALAKLAISRLR